MQVFDVFDGYRLRIEVSEKQLNATLVMLVMKTLCQCTEQIYQHPFAPLHAVPPCAPIVARPQRPSRKPYGFRSMRTRAQRWAQKDTSGAEFPSVRRIISKLHRVVPCRISKALSRLDFVVQPALGREAPREAFCCTLKDSNTILSFCGDP
jgi:hypothetical protein